MIDNHLHRTMTFSEYLASSFDQELIAAIRRHRLILLLGPIVASLLFYAINPNLPGMYVSKAYMRLDGASAELLAEERTYPIVVDRFLDWLPGMKEKSTTSRKTFMELVDVEPPESTARRRLYRLEMTDKDPVVAQSINRQMLEHWLAIHPDFDWSNIIIAPPDVPTTIARRSTTLAALFAGIATLGVLLLLAAWTPLFHTIKAMRLNLPVLGGASAVIVVFWATVFALNYFMPSCLSGPAFELKPPFRKYGAGGAAYLAPAPLLQRAADTIELPFRSPYLICENFYRPLGPPHSTYGDISTKGEGRFSHWTPDGFIFSTSDNSDPNTNGRRYLVTRRDGHRLGGSWSGDVTQSNPPATYRVELQLYGNVGRTAYPSAGCGGELEFLRTDGTSHWYQEHITSGGDKCTDGGLVEMRAQNDIFWNWTWTGSGISATGVLRGVGVSQQ